MSDQRLIAFIDLKDPFMQGPIAGEDRPGPILSSMEARQFSSAVLFHTPHTRGNAEATADALCSRHPRCRVTVRELPVSDPKDYSALMGAVTREIRRLEGSTPPVQTWVCVSSGTAEMRAVWFLLTASGLLTADLLQVGSPAEPLFGAANVREIQLAGGEWTRLRDLLMPMEFFTPPAIARSAPQRELTLAYSIAEIRQPAPAAPPPVRPELDDALQELGIVITSAMMRHAAESAAISAGHDVAVLILGETGTGKDLFARLVHRLSPRRDKPMVAVNCAAIPESLMDSHLFGHMKGSFTGAEKDLKGKFELADGGTLFLDEVGELSPEAQAKLLRVLDTHEVEPIGAQKSRKVDVRVIAATNRDLSEEIAKKRFRSDLYFRLNHIKLTLPPLRDRTAEIPSLVSVFMNRMNKLRPNPRQLSKQALRRLEEHSWPGNVRELEAVLRSSVLMAPEDVLQPEHILIEPLASAPDPLTSLPDPVEGFSLDDFLTQVKRQLILRALAKTGNNQSAAAKLLGISKQAVNQFLKQ